MLAYVFSHRPAPGVDVPAYEDVLREFHRTLAEHPPRGFGGSVTYRTGDGYSDWYLLDGSAALEALNDAAVTGSPAASHHSAARMAVDGVGKLLALAAGEHDLAAACEMRFAKPRGMAYAGLYAGLEPLTAGKGVGLWRRMMVLGPPPEFSITAPAPLELPPTLHAEVVSRSRI